MARGTLTVVLVSANLEHKDLLTSIDPFVILTCGSEKQKSNAAEGQGKNPEWNETFTFTVSKSTSDLNAKVVDKDDIINDVIGKATIPLAPVFEQGDIPQTAYNVVKDEEIKGEIWVALSFKPSWPSEKQSMSYEEESFGKLEKH